MEESPKVIIYLDHKKTAEMYVDEDDIKQGKWGYIADLFLDQSLDDDRITPDDFPLNITLMDESDCVLAKLRASCANAELLLVYDSIQDVVIEYDVGDLRVSYITVPRAKVFSSATDWHSLAQQCCVDLWENNDGSSYRFPVNIGLSIGGKKVKGFSVNLKMEPVFQISEGA